MCSVAFSPFPFHCSVARDRPPAEMLIQSRQTLWSRVTELWLNYASSETEPYQERWGDVTTKCNALARGSKTMQLRLLPDVPEAYGWKVAPNTLFKMKKERGSFQFTQSMCRWNGLFFFKEVWVHLFRGRNFCTEQKMKEAWVEQQTRPKAGPGYFRTATYSYFFILKPVAIVIKQQGQILSVFWDSMML